MLSELHESGPSPLIIAISSDVGIHMEFRGNHWMHVERLFLWILSAILQKVCQKYVWIHIHIDILFFFIFVFFDAACEQIVLFLTGHQDITYIVYLTNTWQIVRVIHELRSSQRTQDIYIDLNKWKLYYGADVPFWPQSLPSQLMTWTQTFFLSSDIRKNSRKEWQCDIRYLLDSICWIFDWINILTV